MYEEHNWAICKPEEAGRYLNCQSIFVGSFNYITQIKWPFRAKFKVKYV